MARRSLVSLVGLALAACVQAAGPEPVAPAPVVAGEGEACGPETACEAGLRCLDDRCSRRCAALAELCGATPCGKVDDNCSSLRVDCAAEGACSHLGLGEACALDGSGCCSSACPELGCAALSCDRVCVESCARPIEIFAEPPGLEDAMDRPSRRSHPSFAGDGRGGALLFGGYTSTLDEATAETRERFLDDTWLFSLASQSWTRVGLDCAAPQPSPRRGSALVWWPPGGVWLLIGGDVVDARTVPDGWIGDQRRQVATNEAWAFDGTCWARFDPPRPWPDVFTFAAAAWDPERRQLVLSSGASPGVTWLLTEDGRWESRATPHGPSKRSMAAIAWDGRGLLLFGGLDDENAAENEYVADTWRWDGTDWVRLEPKVAPSSRKAAQAASMPGVGVLLFGGAGDNGTRADTTWVFHSGVDVWTRRDDVGIATRERHFVAALDEANIVVGYGSESGHAKQDLWLFPLR